MLAVFSFVDSTRELGLGFAVIAATVGVHLTAIFVDIFGIGWTTGKCFKPLIILPMQTLVVLGVSLCLLAQILSPEECIFKFDTPENRIYAAKGFGLATLSGVSIQLAQASLAELAAFTHSYTQAQLLVSLKALVLTVITCILLGTYMRIPTFQLHTPTSHVDSIEHSTSSPLHVLIAHFHALAQHLKVATHATIGAIGFLVAYRFASKASPHSSMCQAAVSSVVFVYTVAIFNIFHLTHGLLPPRSHHYWLYTVLGLTLLVLALIFVVVQTSTRLCVSFCKHSALLPLASIPSRKKAEAVCDMCMNNDMAQTIDLEAQPDAW